MALCCYFPPTEGGRLLACGSNAFGQLGVGETVTHTADPLLVEVRFHEVDVIHENV